MKEKLWKDCLKRAWTKEVILFSVIFGLLSAFRDALGSIFSLIYLVFAVAFAFYVMDLALTKALQRKFVIDEVQVIAAKPKIGKTPAVLFCWNLAYSFLLGVAWIATLGLGGVAMRGAHVDTFTSGIITAVMVVVLIVVTIVAQIKWIYPGVMGHAIGEDRTRHPLMDDFKDKLSLKYFLFILIGYVFAIGAVVVGAIVLVLLGVALDALFKTFIFLLSFIGAFVGNIFVCAGFTYAFSSWLEKTSKLEEIGQHFGLVLKPEFSVTDEG